ncbi:glutathione S-transferase family protein [Phenylobacterium sp.]|uniref:glutathione S-transferase family protein n=1 Tax=Phenylobacterium sp. TaxID=1871053 RepID=UPI002B9D991F|nr:glutathione S-transferase family protein [Phenylobacterium sp.]HVI34406.1 glutathione S-transferase family protein [Phenylobacterium sp.]
MITTTAFKWVPPFAQGLVRDLRVRWALEEAGLPYEARLLGEGDGDTPAYRAVQPWGQVPVFEEDGLTLFESGAILIHLAERSEALAPKDPAGRAKAIQWTIAALNSIEPHVQNLVLIDIFYQDEEWAKLRRPGQEAFTRMKLASLARRLNGREWLEDRFTIGDLMMATVLRLLRHTDIVTADPVLGPYLARCEARPAFKTALADQLATFAAHEPALEPA